jgi:transposase InsO family protein
MSERAVCRALGQPRSTQRQQPNVTIRETTLSAEIIRLACQYGRYGYRRIAEILQAGGWRVNHKCVARIWRQEGLKVPRKQPKRRRLWLNDGSCIRLRPEHKNHVWSYDFVTDRTSNGKAIRMLTILDEHTRECLAIEVGRKLTSYNVIEQLADLMVNRGTPDFIRSDNGPEFTADVIRGWLDRLGVRTLFIEPGSPWENGYIESFNGRLRDELLNGEVFDTLLEAQVIIERWRREYNTKRPHSSLGYRPPTPEAILPAQGNRLDLSYGITNFQVGT